MFGAALCAQSVLINNISAMELSRKFIKGELLVGEEEKGGRERPEEKQVLGGIVTRPDSEMENKVCFFFAFLCLKTHFSGSVYSSFMG